jgi:hypothetical protein
MRPMGAVYRDARGANGPGDRGQNLTRGAGVTRAPVASQTLVGEVQDSSSKVGVPRTRNRAAPGVAIR